MLISEVSQRTGLSPHTIRFYEKQGLLSQGSRNRNNYRRFDENSIYNLIFIQIARDLGFHLKEIKDFVKLFKSKQSLEMIHNTLVEKKNEIELKIKELQNMKRSLDRLIRSCQLEKKKHKLDYRDLLDSARFLGKDSKKKRIKFTTT
ncbi:putative transcriptional regulator, MerR family [Leptospira ryugenii]|uniref:Putative transcriptional regulator, MerR family n=1 Tax=Leptospira ryugenii TaxID=1917863 RepID=A0A2P2E0I2_9LEPT|nr:MerR family transcriptional regulator [Leptospira ryugenii]GBF50379.1 putative transcriptional regulator, MerR family [Leptospira ryugenii]